jgi:hypothetical protein
MNWQPIETAPKDGRKILVYENGEAFCVAWQVDYDIIYPKTKAAQERAKRWCIPESYQDEQGGFFTVDNPTHWAEIEPPEEVAA